MRKRLGFREVQQAGKCCIVWTCPPQHPPASGGWQAPNSSSRSSLAVTTELPCHSRSSRTFLFVIADLSSSQRVQ